MHQFLTALGITAADLHELHGQMLLAGRLPFQTIDAIFVKLYKALGYYDGGVNFYWPVDYQRNYQPLDSSGSHPEDS